jgi:exopolysaccharide production protein ExoQ
LALFVVFGTDMKADIASAVGRDPTFTDRTLVWSYLLKMKTNTLFGTGYESFWLGPRLAELWAAFAFRPNQAHNGFLEVYLNLGLIGCSIVVGFLIASYRTICKRFASSAAFSSLGLALWAVLLICSITTAGYFKDDLLWLTFLLAALAVPVRVKAKVPDPEVIASDGALAEGGGFIGGAWEPEPATH